MSGSTTATNRDFECPVCHEDYAEPKMLPCTHLVCRRCVLTLLTKAGDDSPVGCPTCRSPILPATQVTAEEDLSSLVDALPTDLATMTLQESHKVLQGQHVCKVCENGVVATSFCLQCDVKLCKACSRSHTKLPSLKNHTVEELSKLTPRQLAANYLSRCKAHDDRPAEVYCSTHFQLICMLCATTNHRGCSNVKIIADMAKDKREDLKQEALGLREREKALSSQIKEVKDRFKVLRKRVKDTFDDLQQSVKRRRLEVNALIQAEEDVIMTSVTQLERLKAMVKANASTIEQLVTSAPDVALLDMLGKLTSRLGDLKQQSGTADKTTTVVDVTFEAQKLNSLKTNVSNLGRVTAKAVRRSAHSASKASATTTPTIASTPTTTTSTKS